jgi:glutamate-1-semialdehyde aminotransferase
VFFYTTFGGEALSLAAAKATIEELRRTRAPAQLAEQGRKIKEGFNEIARSSGVEFARCVGLDCRTLVTFDAKVADPLEQKSLVQQELVRRGILWGGFHNMSLSHSDDDVDRTLRAYREVLPILRDAVGGGRVREHLLGEPVAPVFRRTSGFHTKRRTEVPAAAGSSRK